MRSEMPSGKSNAGRRMPNTAGSTSVGEQSTRAGILSIGKFDCMGTAAPTAARIRHQERSHNHPLTTKPHSQMENSKYDIPFVRGAGRVGTGSSTKGTLISATVEIG